MQKTILIKLIYTIKILQKQDKSDEKKTFGEIDKYTSEYKTYILELKDPLSTNENILSYIIESIYNDKNYKPYIKMNKFYYLEIYRLICIYIMKIIYLIREIYTKF